MAVNVRWTHEFKDRTGKGWKVNFCDTEYSGSAQDIEMAADAFTIEYTADDPFTPVISSSGTFLPIIQSITQESWLNTVASSETTGRFTVEIRDAIGDQDLRWVGVIQSDGIEVPYLARPFVCQLHANDDLARLSEVFYNSNGERHAASFPDGAEFIHVHLRRCLLNLRTIHHWEDTDILLQLSGFYIAEDSTNGLTDVKVPTEAFTILPPEDQTAVDHFTCLKVLQEFATIFGSRMVLDAGTFSFHSIAAFEDAPSYVVPNWINYAKNGSAYILPSGFNAGLDLDDVKKHAGWSTRYLPGIKSVTMPSRYAYTFPVGIVQWLPPLNQIDQGENNLDGVFYNTLGDAAYLDSSLGGSYFVSYADAQSALSFFALVAYDLDLNGYGTTQQRLVRFEFRALVAFTLANGPNAGTTYYATNDLEVDEDNTTPLILNNGQLFETPTVTRGPVTWSTNSNNRLKFASACFDADSPDDFVGVNQEFFTQLPPIDTADHSVGYWQFGGQILPRESDNSYHPFNTVITQNEYSGYYYGIRVNPTASILEDDETLTHYAENADSGHRERLTLPESVFSGFGGQSLGVFLVDVSGDLNAQLSFSTPIDDGDDFIGQLLVEDVLRLRASPRRILSGPGTVSVGVRRATFNKIYHDPGINPTRWALLSLTWNGGTGVCDMELFELNRETLTMDNTGGGGIEWGSENLGAPKYGGGSVTPPPQPPPNQIAKQKEQETFAELVRDKVPAKTRQILNRTVRATGHVTPQALNVATTTPAQLRLLEGNTGTDYGTTYQAIQFNPNQTANATWMLPRTNANIQAVVTYGTTDGGVTNTMQGVTGTTGQVLKIGSNGKPAFVDDSSGGGGTAFYTFTGYASWKGSAGEYFNMAGDLRGTAANQGTTTIAIPEDATAAKFAVFCQASPGSSSLRLVVNGSVAETETFVTTTNLTATGTFSTSVNAGDKLSFWMDPTNNPSKATLVVQFTV